MPRYGHDFSICRLVCCILHFISGVFLAYVIVIYPTWRIYRYNYPPISTWVSRSRTLQTGEGIFVRCTSSAAIYGPEILFFEVRPMSKIGYKVLLLCSFCQAVSR